MTADETLSGLLDRLDETLGRYVAFPSDGARHAVAAWIVHCHAIEAFDSTPRLAVLSPEKGSGKTRVMEVVELHVPDPMLTVNISAAALFRKIAADGTTTVLLDEADTYLGMKVAKEHEDIRGLVNAGHRRGANVLRAAIGVKGGVTVEEFSAFAPVALAGIGDLPDTILDRSVVVAMRRRRPDEHVEPFRWRKAEGAASALCGEIAEWADRAVRDLEGVEPDMPPGIVDRPADVWEPLVVIGDAAGEPWRSRIRDAAVELNTLRSQRDPSLGVQLLRDLRVVFGGRDRMTTEALVEALCAIDTSPWADLRGKPIDARGIANRLKKYGIRSGDHRFDDVVKKGYLREDLHDAWERYLPPDVAHVADVALPDRLEGESEGSMLPFVAFEEGGEVLDLKKTASNGHLFDAPGAQGQHGQQAQQGLCAECGERPAGSFSDYCARCNADLAEATS